MKLRTQGALFAGFACALLASPAFSQTTGGIAGQVLDASTNQPVADAVVVVLSPSLQGEQTALTDKTGNFEVTLLPQGVYSLNVQRDGFKPSVTEGLTVRLDSTIRVKLNIYPEAIQGSQVEIAVQAPVIALNNTHTGGTVTKEQMQLVPYGRSNRNFDSVLASVPGVVTDNLGYQLNGSQSLESSYIIDGVNVTDPGFNSQGTNLLQDFIQEVDVKSGGYQAEYGRASGGIVTAITKSGSNEFHGSIFVNYTPFEASRKQIASLGSIAQQAKLAYNLDFGAEVGGPILKDKLWFYAGFAPQYEVLNTDRIIQRQIDDGTGRPKLDSSGATVFSPVAKKTYKDTTTHYQFTGKLTYNLSENHSLSAQAFGGPNKRSGASAALEAGSPAAPSLVASEGRFLGENTGNSYDTSLSYRGKLFNKAMLVEATAYYHTSTQTRAPSAFNGLSTTDLLDTPGITFLGTRNLLDPSIADRTAPDYQSSADVVAACQIQANGFNPCPVTSYATGGIGFLRKISVNRINGILKLSNYADFLGHHQFKYGLDAAQDRYTISKRYTGDALWTASGSTYSVSRHYGLSDPSNPSQPLLDGSGNFLGLISSSNTRNVTLAGFAQDSWSVHDKVSIDFGLRYEKQLMYQDPTKTVYDTSSTPTAFAPGVAPINLNNLMPRVGIIYDFTGRGLSKVYASYGRFYEYIPLDLADRTLSGEKRVRFNADANSCSGAITSGVTVDPRNCSIIPGAIAGATYGFTGAGLGNLIDRNLKAQYNDEFQLGARYQAIRDIIVGVDLVHKQTGRVVEDMSDNDGNSYFLANPGEPGPGFQVKTANGTIVPEPKPRRLYDAMTLSVNKQFSDSYFVTASYTYSSNRGNYPGLFRPENNQTDPNLTSEYDLASSLANKDGPLPTDIPNAFKVDAGYVFEISPKIALKLGASGRATQGTPLNVLARNPTAPGYGTTESFVLPRGADGRLPWKYSVDLRAAADYKISSHYALGFHVDLQNITNYQPVIAQDPVLTTENAGSAPITAGSLADLPYIRNGQGQPITLNPTFRAPTQYALPFQARFGASLSF